MKLELKHLATYLPYNLSIMMLSEPNSREPNIQELKSIDIDLKMVNFGWGNAKELDEIKPILRPLSDLVSECTTDDEVGSISWVSHLLGKELRYFNYLTYKPVFNNYWEFELLVKNHFDVFGLIDKGLAIDINTLNV